MNKLSIIICTYNREKYLAYALESLVTQTEEQENFEVLIIDNNSKDNTRKVFEKFENKLPLKYFLEKKQGLSHARNRGIKESKYDYVAFLDDDAKASKDWVKKSLEIINGKKADIFGGPIHPYYESEKPKWFKDEYEIRQHGRKSKYLYKGHLSGSNIFFKKEIFKKIGNFDPNYGMKGNKIFLGEETKLQKTAKQKGIKCFYDPKLFVYHLVPEYKMKVLYFIKRGLADQVTAGKFFKEKGAKGILLPPVVCLRTIKGFLMLPFIFFRNRKKYPYWQNYFIEKVLRDILSVAKIKGLFIK
jgi:glycosyltransferase involved in cell wall biosynthesis